MAEASPRILHGRQASAEKVVELPNLVTGKLADVIESASAAGTSRELAGEQDARSAFRSEVALWPKTKRLRWRNPAAVVVASSASLLIATSSLAAATGFPAPAARVVDQVLSQVGITDQFASPGRSAAPSDAPEMPPTPDSPSAASGSATHPPVVASSACTGHGVRRPMTSSQLNASSPSTPCGHQRTAIGPTGTTRRETGVSPSGNQSAGNLGSAGVIGGIASGAGSVVGSANQGSGNQGSGSGGSTGAGGNQGTSGAPATNQGGNQGTSGATGTNQGGSQATSGSTGTNRGGNQGTSGNTGTKRGGKRGSGGNRTTSGSTGTKRGGKPGSGTVKGSAGGHRHKGAQTKLPGGSGTPSTTHAGR